MSAQTTQLLKVYFQRRFRWTRFGYGWIVLRPWMRIAPFFLFGLTHVSDASPITVLLLNLGIWSMLEATYQAGVLSWRYFEKEEFLLKPTSLWKFYFVVGAIEALTVVPMILAASVVERSMVQLVRSIMALPILILMFGPFVIALGDVSRRVSTRFWDLKFIGGYIISALIFTAPVLRPFQSTLGVQIFAWNPIGLPFWVGREYVLEGVLSAPIQSVFSFAGTVATMLFVTVTRSARRGRRHAVLRTPDENGQILVQPRSTHPMEDELEASDVVLPNSHEGKFEISRNEAGIDIVRMVVGDGRDGVMYRTDEVQIEVDVFNHSVVQSTYPRLHVHKHDGKHIFSLEWPDGKGLRLPQGRITQFSTKIPGLTLGSGLYFLSLDVCTYDPFRRFLTTNPIVRFEIVELQSELPEVQRSPHDRKGYFQPHVGWRAKSLSIEEYACRARPESSDAGGFN